MLSLELVSLMYLDWLTVLGMLWEHDSNCRIVLKKLNFFESHSVSGMYRGNQFETVSVTTQLMSSSHFVCLSHIVIYQIVSSRGDARKYPVLCDGGYGIGQLDVPNVISAVLELVPPLVDP